MTQASKNPAYMVSYDGTTYGNLTLNETGWNFDFRVSGDVHAHVEEARGRQNQTTSTLRGVAPEKRDTLSDFTLDGVPDDRRLPQWLEFAPDDQRDALIRKALDTPEIDKLWKQVVICAGAKPSSPIRSPPARRTGKAAAHNPRQAGSKRKRSSPSGTKADEKALEVALSKLCNAFRIVLRRLSRFLDEGEDDGWGICLPSGSYEMPNPDPDDPEVNKPDIAFFSRDLHFSRDLKSKRDKGSQPEATWADVITTIGFKLYDREDLSLGVMTPCLEHARNVVQYHPLCTVSHQVTVTGTRLLLWQFTPTCYATSRALSFSRESDRLAIGQVLALLVAADSDSLIRQWVPPSKFDVQVPDREGNVSEGKTETWEWSDGHPKVVHARPELWGSRTAVFGGPAHLIHPPGATPTFGDDRLARLDIDGSRTGEELLTIVKCSFLPEHLIGREGEMQRHIAGLAGTPAPIGDVNSADDVGDPHAHRQAEGSRYMYALAYQHALGARIPDDISEQDLCKLFEELTDRLCSMSESGAHYRDLNTGNVLWRRDNNGEPRLVLIDHGNMRFDGKRRGTYELDSESSTMDFYAIAEDDVDSANPLFLPSSMAKIKEVLHSRELAEARKARLEVPDSPDVAAMRAKQDARRERNLLLYCHSHIDDLESACWLLLWYGLRRSFSLRDTRFDALHGNLRDQSNKRDMWEHLHKWDRTVDTYCPAMSEAWRAMMRDLNLFISLAQSDRRLVLESDPTLNAQTPEELSRITDIERECFTDVSALYAKYRPMFSSDKFKLLNKKDVVAQASKGKGKAKGTGELIAKAQGSTSASEYSPRVGSLLGPSRNSRLGAGLSSSPEEDTDVEVGAVEGGEFHAAGLPVKRARIARKRYGYRG